jgi:preprotein translocase subunit SecD
MNRYPLWKYLIIGIALLFGLIYTLPNFYGEDPAVQVAPARATGKLDPALTRQVEQTLAANHLAYKGVEADTTGTKVRFNDTNTQLKAKDVLQQSLGQGYSVALNLLSSSPKWLASIGALPMYLGLDLRGGVHFLLQVDMQAAIKKALDRNANDIRSLLREKDIHYSGLDRRPDAINVNFQSEQDLNAAQSLVQGQLPDLAVTTQNSGGSYVLNAKLSQVAQKRIQDYALQQNITTLRNRVNELGVAEPIIQQQGADRIVVELPGVQDTAKAKEILGRTASLEVRMVDEEHMQDPTVLQNALHGQVPFDDELYRSADGTPYLVKKEVVLTGDYITDAAPGMDDRTGQPVVNLRLDGRGARIFQDVTRANVGKRMAILLIEKNSTQVVTAPVIREEIGGGRVQISGMTSIQDATDTALLLRAGALAAPMNIIEERTVGPSLGADNIKRGFDSTLIGFAAIAVAMVVYYRVFGLIASLALAFNLLLLVAILSVLQATLTLPGIAGIALTIGMSIDANVLIYERIREELRNGNTPQTAIHAGYDRAFDTILDSNITTFIAGIALFWLGSGPVRGFAITLCIGIITSMFTAIMGTRAIVNLTYGRKRKLAKIAI